MKFNTLQQTPFCLVKTCEYVKVVYFGCEQENYLVVVVSPLASAALRYVDFLVIVYRNMFIRLSCISFWFFYCLPNPLFLEKEAIKYIIW